MKTKHLINRAIQKYVPNNLIMYKPDIVKARKRFNNSPTEPMWLENHLIEELEQKYPIIDSYKYDLSSLEKRGEVSAKRIIKLLPLKITSIIFLELGCYDGMTSYALNQKGHTTLAIDNNSYGFDKRARDEGVIFGQMNAEKLDFLNNSMDVVFSFNMFEHLNNPEIVLREALRVTQPYGYIYLKFAPLYYSPMGLHAYKSVTIPYCQFLFPKEELLIYTDREKFSDLNKWSLIRYRNLWHKFSNELKVIYYKEQLDISHVNLISKYPSCFKSKSTDFNNFLVTSIEVLFQKRRIQK